MAKQNSAALTAALKSAGASSVILTIHHDNALFDNDGVEFFVEAKPNRRWVTVAGPFGNFTQANIFSMNYSRENHVSSRVVAFQ
ncbi:hypothetical protein BH10BAC2_BH10BAC2_18790 [soil metagenome]